jgi:hypothetical protein
MAKIDEYRRQNKDRDTNRDNKPWWRPLVKSLINPANIQNMLLAIFTLLLVVVATLQYGVFDEQRIVLDKTDQTLKDTLAANKAIQRAFVNIDELRVERINGAELSYKFTPIIQNNGVTSARNVVLKAADPFIVYSTFVADRRLAGYIQIKTQSSQDPANLGNEISGGLFILRNFTIGPHATVNSEIISRQFTAAGLNNTGGNPVSLGNYFFGYISYDDIFDVPHVSMYCFVRALTGFAPIVSICRHWNCTDKDCDKDRGDYENEVRKATAEWPEIDRRLRPGTPPPITPQAPQ